MDIINALVTSRDWIKASTTEMGCGVGWANMFRKAIRDKAPVDTGNLKRRIVVKKVRHDQKGVAFLIGPSGKAFFARMIEFGTSKMPARPFIRPAFDENKDKVHQAIKQALERAILKEAYKLADQHQARRPRKKR